VKAAPLVFIVLAVALAAAPASTSGDAELGWILHQRCVLEHAGAPGPRGDKLVVVSAQGRNWIRRDGRRIEVLEWTGAEPCRGGQPTVDNIDWIILKSAGEGIYVDASQGRFGPGATREPGRSEIEIRTYGKAVTYRGTARADRVVAESMRRHLAVDLDAPARGAGGEVDLLGLGIRVRRLLVSGGRGPDLIDARRLIGFEGLAHRLLLRGAAGDDKIFGSPGSDWQIEDGPGDDLVHAGGGDDLFFGGRGHDRFYGGAGADDIRYAVYRRYEQTFPDAADEMYGGRGNDKLDDRNGRRDLLRCGPGKDRVRRELFDRPGPDCEIRLGPKSQPAEGGSRRAG
jgi:RTX calcium-binding nonapeptide repeat (4 copies)